MKRFGLLLWLVVFASGSVWAATGFKYEFDDHTLGLWHSDEGSGKYHLGIENGIAKFHVNAHVGIITFHQQESFQLRNGIT